MTFARYLLAFTSILIAALCAGVYLDAPFSTLSSICGLIFLSTVGYGVVHYTLYIRPAKLAARAARLQREAHRRNS